MIGGCQAHLLIGFIEKKITRGIKPLKVHQNTSANSHFDALSFHRVAYWRRKNGWVFLININF
jgi:uncharacterized protein (UPF0548 family)